MTIQVRVASSTCMYSESCNYSALYCFHREKALPVVDVGVVEERQQRLKTLPTLMKLLQLLHHHPLDVGVVEGEVDVAEADDREKRPSQRSEESSHSWLCTVLGLR